MSKKGKKITEEKEIKTEEVVEEVKETEEELDTEVEEVEETKEEVVEETEESEETDTLLDTLEEVKEKALEEEETVLKTTEEVKEEEESRKEKIDEELDKLKEEKKRHDKKEMTEIERKIFIEKIAIAGLVSVFILLVIAVLFWIYLEKYHYRTVLIETMNSKREYFDTYGNKFTIKGDKINNNSYKPVKYSFVDFDEDELDELVVFIVGGVKEDFYLIFKYIQDDKKVLGYLINASDFQALRLDGTVATTGTDGVHKYYDIKFKGNEMYFEDLAIHRAKDNYYNVYGDDVYRDMFEDFVDEWMERDSAVWATDLIEW